MQKGFTLVEVAVSIALFAILAYAGTTFFIQAVRDSGKVAIENEVRETGVSIMADIETEIKAVASQTKSGQYCARAAPCGSKYCFYLSDGTPEALDCRSNYTRLVTYKSDAVAGTLTKTITLFPSGVDGPELTLNSARAYVSKCDLSGGGCSSASCTSGLVVSFDVSTNTPTVNLYVQQASSVTKTNYCARSQITRTVTPRLRP